MVKRSEIVSLGGLPLKGHGLSVGFDLLGLSSRVRRAAPSLQMQSVEPVRGGQLWRHQDGHFDHAVPRAQRLRGGVAPPEAALVVVPACGKHTPRRRIIKIMWSRGSH